MTRDGKRLLAALIAAALLAAGLGACGGSNSDSSSSTEATATEGSTTSAASEGKSRDKSGGQSQNEGQGRGQDQGQNDSQGDHRRHRQESSSSGSQNVATPLKVSGGGSAQFRTKGGDNSVQEYGEEGDESELQEVAEIVHRFYVARVEEQWDTACSYLAKSNIEQLEQLASQSPQFKGAGCALILHAFTRPLPAAVQREITTIDAGSFRHDGERGFLIYYGPEHTVYSMPMRNEGGAWKVAALSGSAIG